MAITWVDEPRHPAGGYWKADFPGPRHRIQHRHPDQKSAEKDVIDNGGPDSHYLRPFMLLSSVVDAYESWLKGTGRITYAAELRRVRRCLLPYLERPIAYLTREHFAAILEDHQRPDKQRPWLKPEAIGPWPYSAVAKKTKPSTIALHFKALAAFMFFCVSRGFRETDPVHELAATVRVPKPIFTVVVPHDTHLTTIRSQSTLPQRVVLGLMTGAGATPTEVGRMLWKDIDLLEDTIFLRHVVYSIDDPNRPAGRIVPLPLELKIDLVALRAATGGEPDRPVIAPGNRTLRDSQAIIEIIAMLQVRAGYPGRKIGKSLWNGKYRPIDFRNVAAVRWCKQHKNVRVVSELLNLTPAITRKRYARWLDRKGDVAAFHARQARKAA